MKPNVFEILREVRTRLGEATLMNVYETISDCRLMINDCIKALEEEPAQEPSDARGRSRVRITTQVGDKEPESMDVELPSDDLVDLFAHLFD